MIVAPYFFVKVAYQLCEEILKGTYQSEDRIPSVRGQKDDFRQHQLPELFRQARIVAYITLTSADDHTVVFNQQVSGYTWLSVFNSMAKTREYTQNNLWVDAAAAMRRAYPLRGHMLEKGFQKGKKQKLQEFYIDLGSDHRLFTNSEVDVYVVRRIAGRIARQYIGSGRVLEVQGQDISVCKVRRNGDQIKQAFDRGAEIAVQVY